MQGITNVPADERVGLTQEQEAQILRELSAAAKSALADVKVISRHADVGQPPTVFTSPDEGSTRP
jgi:hypothetical protein